MFLREDARRARLRHGGPGEADARLDQLRQLPGDQRRHLQARLAGGRYLPQGDRVGDGGLARQAQHAFPRGRARALAAAHPHRDGPRRPRRGDGSVPPRVQPAAAPGRAGTRGQRRPAPGRRPAGEGGMIVPASDAAAAPGLLSRLSTMAANLTKVTTTRAPIGQTPRQVIWTLNKATLFRYTPVVRDERRHPIPLLLVFALMNKSSILDLRPGNSFVEFLLQKGYDVYLLDWGTPGPEDAQTDLGDYLLEYLPRAIRKLKSFSGSAECKQLGVCTGAMLSTLYASLRPSDGLKSLILLTAPLDFTQHDKISLARMTDERSFDVDRVLQACGNRPAGLIDYGAKMLTLGEEFGGG